MKKAGADPKVKKTLLRNYEQSVPKPAKAAYDNDAGPSISEKSSRNKKVFELDEPTLCSSETLGNYLTDIRKSAARPRSAEELQLENAEISAKITKKLNFHFNDRIYKNLVELNSDIAKSKSGKDKRQVRSAPIKKDFEPSIDDFCQDEKERDLCPHIPKAKCKMKPIKRIDDGRLHRLVASFEKL